MERLRDSKGQVSGGVETWNRNLLPSEPVPTPDGAPSVVSLPTLQMGGDLSRWQESGRVTGRGIWAGPP